MISISVRGWMKRRCRGRSLPRWNGVTGSLSCSSRCVVSSSPGPMFSNDCSSQQSSRPSRISEAEPYLRDLLMSPTVLQDSTHHSEIHANLLLAAALSSPASKSTVARDSEAILLFSRYFTIYDMQPRDAPPSPVILPSLSRLPNTLGLSVPTTPLRTCNRVLPCKTELWARAAFAGLLQRLGLEGEAHKQTELIRLVFHSFCLSCTRALTGITSC